MCGRVMMTLITPYMTDDKMSRNWAQPPALVSYVDTVASLKKEKKYLVLVQPILKTDFFLFIFFATEMLHIRCNKMQRK